MYGYYLLTVWKPHMKMNIWWKKNITQMQIVSAIPVSTDMSPDNHKETETLDRGSIASQCMDIHRNPRISKWISIKAWMIED